MSTIERYSDEPIQYTSERVEGDLAVVSTRILATQEQEIPVVYRMLRHGDRWLIYDVSVEGVSLVANYRTQFNNVIRTSSTPSGSGGPLIGGDGPTTFDRVIEFGDGLMPILRPHVNPVQRIPELRQRLKNAGRDPKSAPVSIFFAPAKHEALDALGAAGVERAIFGLPCEGRDAILPHLDAYAKVMRG